MNGATLVHKLEQDFQRIETPLHVVFDSPEDARALMYWVTAPHLFTEPAEPEWWERISPAILAIAAALALSNSEEGT